MPSIAAYVEVCEHKTLLTSFAWPTDLTLPHSHPLPSAPQTATTSVIYGTMDGAPYAVTITATPTKGTVANNGDGTFTYTANPNEIGADSFTFMVTESGQSPQSVTVPIDITNTDPIAQDDFIFVPIASTDVIIVPINDFDLDGDEWQVISVTSLGDGTASTDGENIFYYPPTDPSNGATEAKQELFVHLEYQIQDAVGAVALAQVKNTVEDEFIGYRTYSRGNDDPQEEIYETAKIKVMMSAFHGANEIRISYGATASTNKKWQGTDQYEGQYFAQNHLIRLFAAEGNDGDAIAAGTPSDDLFYSAAAGDPDPGIGGTIWGSLTVGSFQEGDTSASGTAVIQMVKKVGNTWYYDGPARQRIPWSLGIRKTGADERFTMSFTVAEIVVPASSTPPGVDPRLDTPLRIGQHDLYLTTAAKGTMQTPYPKEPMKLLRDRSVGGDLRRPASPPADWDLLIPNDGSPLSP